jgi:hypothetical protein
MDSFSGTPAEKSTRWSTIDTLIPVGSGNRPTACGLTRVAFSTAARSIVFPDSNVDCGPQEIIALPLNRSNKAKSSRKTKTRKSIEWFTLVELKIAGNPSCKLFSVPEFHLKRGPVAIRNPFSLDYGRITLSFVRPFHALSASWWLSRTGPRH